MDRVSLRLLLGQGADVLTFLAFYLLVGPSIHEERNPMILLLMALGGVQLVGLVKMAITLFVIRRRVRTIKVVFERRWYRPAQTIAMSAATASGIVGAGFNLAAIVSTMLRG
jgi:hypothetical protein